MDTASAKVIWRKAEGTYAHLAISNRLYAAMSKPVEASPYSPKCLINGYIHSVRTPGQCQTGARSFVPLVQPYLQKAPLCKVLDYILWLDCSSGPIQRSSTTGGSHYRVALGKRDR